MIDCFCKEIGETSYRKDSASSNLSTMTFSPPAEYLYFMKTIENFSKKKMVYQTTKFIHFVFPNIEFQWVDINSYFVYKKETTKTRIAVIHIKHKINTEKTSTILFSHGNSSTLGHLYPFLFDLSSTLKCDVISFDYSGYGQSTGTPNEKVIYSDIQTVWSFMTEILNLKANQVILMGYSLGSAPTVELGIQKECKNISGMILLSPIASCISLSMNSQTDQIEQKNVLCNRLKVSQLKCPMFLIHGLLDQVIPIKHAFELEKYTSFVYTWYPKFGDHKNIITDYRTKFMMKCKHFINSLIQNGDNNIHFLKESNKIILNPKKLIYRQECLIETIKSNIESSIEEEENISLHYKKNNTNNIQKSNFTIKNFDVYGLPTESNINDESDC